MVAPWQRTGTVTGCRESAAQGRARHGGCLAIWEARPSDVKRVRADELRPGLGVLVFEDEGDRFDEIVVEFVEGERLGPGALEGEDVSDMRAGPIFDRGGRCPRR